MFSTEDTIVAIATPPGRGGLGVVRISGAQAEEVTSKIIERQTALTPRRATLTRVGTKSQHGETTDFVPLDQVMVTLFCAPASYTGDDVVEISAHGSPLLLRAIVKAAVEAGARLAEPGEFTLRAVLNGRTDLVQAEAVGDLINAVTPGQARVAFDQLQGTLTGRIGEINDAIFDLIVRLEASLDFPEEGYHFVTDVSAEEEVHGILTRVETLLAEGRRGRIIREGRQAVILGRPNVGKSSIFNALCGFDRAIVSEKPGTTRDLLSEVVALEELSVTLVDTAGIRGSSDPVETEGVTRARGAKHVADVILLVLDRSECLSDEDRWLLEETSASPRLVVASKTDLKPEWSNAALGDITGAVVDVSVVTDEGLIDLRRRLTELVAGVDNLQEMPQVTNIRHINLLELAQKGLIRAVQVAQAKESEEFILADLQIARSALEEISGKRTPEDVLARIFEQFCIGK